MKQPAIMQRGWPVRRRPMVGATLAAVIALTSWVQCSGPNDESRESGRETTISDPRDVVSEPLMIALGQAKNFHRKADVYLKDGNTPQAIASLQKIFDIPFPQGAAEAEDVVLDAHARLAKLHLATGDVARAMMTIEAGIGKSTRNSFFLANLHTVRGETLDAKADAIATTDAAAAKALRIEAIKAYDESITINTELQKRLLEDEASP